MDNMAIPFRSELFLSDMHVTGTANTNNIKCHLQTDTQTPATKEQAMDQPTVTAEEPGEIAHQRA
jgi:hypothetical protein